MRIAILSAHSCPVGQLGTRDTGGMSVYIREIARELGKRGHRVDVFTRVHDPDDPLTESLGKNARLVHLRAGEDEIMHKLVLYSYLPDFACGLEAFRKRHHLKYDLVFSHYWLSGQVGEEVSRWWGVPHLIMFHTLGAIKNSLGVGEEEPPLRIESEKALARSCRRIIVATGKEKESIIGLLGVPEDKITVIPCGVNLRTFHPVSRAAARSRTGFSEGPVILAVARMEPLKGIERLVRAFARTHDPAARLVVVGGDDESAPEIERLGRLAAELGVGARVTFTGAVKHELMPYYYNAADVCVVPSYYESFGLVALESLACGTPVVATDVGNLAAMIREGETGFVVQGASDDALAGKIEEVLAWPRRTMSRARKTRASVSSYSWTDAADRVETEFKCVLEERRCTA